MYKIVRFYIESSQDKAETTRSHAAEVIQRILEQISAAYGVTVTDEGLSGKITGMNADILQDWYNRQAKTCKVSTMNNYVCMLNPFLRWAWKGKRTEDDFSGILNTKRLPSPESVPISERPKDKYLNHEEAYALLHCSGRNAIRDRAIIALFLCSGLRVSELCSLNLSDVIGRPRGTLEVRRKGGEYKIVEVAPEFYEALEAYLQTRSDLSDLSHPLFLTTHGERINRKQVHKFLSHKQKKLGVATGPHALRHTFLSETEKIGGAAVARDLANQRSLVVTNRYVHTTSEQRQATVRQLKWNKIPGTHDHHDAQD